MYLPTLFYLLVTRAVENCQYTKCFFFITATLNTERSCTRSSPRCRARRRPTRAAPWRPAPPPPPRRSPPRKQTHDHRTRPSPIGHTISAKAMLFIFIRKHFTFVQSYKLEHRACAEQNTQAVTNFFYKLFQTCVF